MAKEESNALVGCLLDVSGSMRQPFETGRSDERAIDRFHVVLSAALKIARQEERMNSKSKMFVGAFGLDQGAGYPSTVDLCGIAEALLDGADTNGRSGHELLIGIANESNLAHISEYIRTKLTDNEARILAACLRRHPERISEFIDAIPSAEELENSRSRSRQATGGGSAILFVAGTIAGGPAVGGILADVGLLGGRVGAEVYEDRAVESSEGFQLARRMCKEWFQDFQDFTPRTVSAVVHLLQELEGRHAGPQTDLSGTIEEFIYGKTPLCDALNRSLRVFREHRDFDERVLVLLSDGCGTDGDPNQIASELHSENVTVAGMYLTNDRNIAQRVLYDQPVKSWSQGQRTLFDIASKISAAKHPIPVLMSVGWQAPSSGEVALYASVCTDTAVEEFCSLLISAHLGSTDALLDIIGRLELDRYINNELVTTCQNPSDQKESSTCYAHAVAGVMHMALLRIERNGPCRTIENILKEILGKFPPDGGRGHPTKHVLEEAIRLHETKHKELLRYKEVDEKGARQAVLHRRPVLATFRLSEEGWWKFKTHFHESDTRRSILTEADMRPYRQKPDNGGHAVILYACAPNYLSFLNSWGDGWGVNGSFRVESPATLELDEPYRLAPMRFYDVFWYEDDLTLEAKEAYKAKVDERIRTYTTEYPSLLELEATCPLCGIISLISDFTGNARKARCPQCTETFVPRAEDLLQALYARAGLGL